ncbi:MAG: TIGR00701 family protein [Rhizobiales bacterium TMED249]|nr:MAG: TIGR00701 family protein [Rhizobiales bacterium TMED249]
MADILTGAYTWLLALHLISVMFWMAGMYYLPRLFVYHAEAMENNEPYKIFERMEYNLIRIIINPAMIAAWIFGLLLLFSPGQIESAGYWLPIKLSAVIILSGYHGMLSSWRKKFLLETSPKSSKFFRMVNEIPPILTFLIVIMVIVKPF